MKYLPLPLWMGGLWLMGYMIEYEVGFDAMQEIHVWLLGLMILGGIVGYFLGSHKDEEHG